MADQRPSNVKRSEWNRKCREKLSRHINDKLSIFIEPSQVRLKPNHDDVYTWERMIGIEHLFLRNISDHSVSALKQLYREVGKSFEAVKNEKSCELPAGTVARTHLHFSTDSLSFNSRINELQSRLEIQLGELKQWQNQADSEAEMRWQAEMKINELDRIIQAAEKDNQRLEIEVQEWKLVAGQYKTKAMKYDQAIRKILICLEEVKPESDR